MSTTGKRSWFPRRPMLNEYSTVSCETAEQIYLYCGFSCRIVGRSTIKDLGALLKGGNHAPNRFAEQHFDQALQDPRLELEIDEKIEATAARHPLEDPMV
ncbi:MAG TPA: hypothetical protein VK554_03545, partial [Bradyrhizobium sp.]|nr:hypothetical protein [Bradyrhizobium sp.]